MFKELLNLAYKRSALQALGFYLVAFVVMVALAGAIGGLLGMAASIDPRLDSGFGLQVGTIFAALGCPTLALVILQQKNQLEKAVPLLIALSSGLAAFLGGSFLGLIPVALLTMYPTSPTPTPHA